MVAALYDFNEGITPLPCLAGVEEHFLLSAWGLNSQTGQNNFEHQTGRSVPLFFMVAGSNGAFLYLCLGLHNFVFYQDDGDESLVQNLTVEEITITILPGSYFISHGHMQRMRVFDKD